MSNHGRNPLYEQWDVYPSYVAGKIFLNVSYRNDEKNRGEEEGYFFARIIKMNSTYDTITTAIVADSTLKYITNSRDVRARIEKDSDVPSFYSDTLHFYKVSGYHLDLRDAVEIANPHKK